MILGGGRWAAAGARDMSSADAQHGSVRVRAKATEVAAAGVIAARVPIISPPLVTVATEIGKSSPNWNPGLTSLCCPSVLLFGRV